MRARGGRTCRTGQKAEIGKADKQLKQSATTTNEFSWASDTLVFDNTPLPEVLSSLEDHYDINFSTGTQFDMSRTFTNTFVDQRLEEVLQEMEVVLGFNYTIDNDKVIVE